MLHFLHKLNNTKFKSKSFSKRFSFQRDHSIYVSKWPIPKLYYERFQRNTTKKGLWIKYEKHKLDFYSFPKNGNKENFICWQHFKNTPDLGVHTKNQFGASITFLRFKKTCPSELYKTKQTKIMIICEFFISFLVMALTIIIYVLMYVMSVMIVDGAIPRGMFYVAYKMWHLNSIDDIKFWFYYSMIRTFL